MKSLSIGIIILAGLSVSMGMVKISYAVDAATLPVSKGVYRLPYQSGTMVTMSNDHTNHPTTLNRIDMTGQGGGQHTVVAAGDGIIRRIQDENNTFCPNSATNDPAICNGYSGPSAACCERDNTACNSACANNYIWIEHTNGEWTKYTHIRNNSADNLGRFEGEFVADGTPLGIEGDVGFASGPHVHFEVARPKHVQKAPPAGADMNSPPDVYSDWFDSAGFLRGDDDPGTVVDSSDGTTAIDYNRQNRIPIFCQLGFAEAGETYLAQSCDGLCGSDTAQLLGAVLDNDIFQQQVTSSMTNLNSSFTVRAGGGASLRAGQRITLAPGFHAEPNAYFSASIGACDSPGN